MTTPNGHRYHLTLTNPELSTIHFAILQTRAKARRRLRRGCRRCQRLFDAAQAMHQRLLPLRAKAPRPNTGLDAMYSLNLSGHDIVHLKLALSTSSILFTHGTIQRETKHPAWAKDGHRISADIDAQASVWED